MPRVLQQKHLMMVNNETALGTQYNSRDCSWMRPTMHEGVKVLLYFHVWQRHHREFAFGLPRSQCLCQPRRLRRVADCPLDVKA